MTVPLSHKCHDSPEEGTVAYCQRLTGRREQRAAVLSAETERKRCSLEIYMNNLQIELFLKSAKNRHIHTDYRPKMMKVCVHGFSSLKNI